MQICFATNNQHKIDEVQAVLPATIRLLSLKDIGCREELPETGRTLEENSRQKAFYVFNKYHCHCFADDTGLEVEALNGRPGVFSSRYAGLPPDSAKNMEKLLSELKDQPNRNAQFRTIVTLVIENEVHQFEGVLKGKIIDDQRGNFGFGYDPIFVPLGGSDTLAEMSPKIKNKISHRALATQKLIAFLSENFLSGN